MRKISVCDFTLRQFAQSGKNDLLFREKTAIAACADKIGADKIELPAVKRVKEDTIICKTISSVVVNAELAIPVGDSAESVDAAWECVKGAKKPCLQVALPVSTAQMEYGYRMKEPAMLELIKNVVTLAKAKCKNVEFVALDATRADEAFLINACLAAKECGAVCITVCDDAGISLPAEIAALAAKVKAECGLPLYVCLSDNISMAVAGAIAAVDAGADGVKSSMSGSGVLLTEKFAEAVKVKGGDIGVSVSLKLTEIHRDINETLKNIVSETETAAPSAGFAAPSDIFLDSQSTVADVAEAAKALGYDLPENDNGKVHKALMQVCEQKSSVGSKELEALIASYALQAPSAYHLVSYTANCSGAGASMAQVTLQNGEEILNGVAVGDGPIDSAFRAIESVIGHHYELDDFQIQSVTEGKEALGSTLVRLRSRGRLYSGTGLSTDIVGASIRAYINALNKIVYEEN